MIENEMGHTKWLGISLVIFYSFLANVMHQKMKVK
jgi:hypothetical protein